MKVEAASESKLPTHKITIVRSEASRLPDIPTPTALKETPPMREVASIPTLSFGVMVYDGSLSHIQWTDPHSKNSYAAYCAWDCSLLAAFSQITIDEKPHFFLMLASRVVTAKQHKYPKNETPTLPKLAENTYTIVKGVPASTEAIKVLAALKKIYLKNKDQLVLIHKAKEEQQAAANAWHKANPPKPQSHTFWLKPHRGSRYLIEEGGAK